jgi:hypothetical protein
MNHRFCYILNRLHRENPAARKNCSACGFQMADPFTGMENFSLISISLEMIAGD